MAIAVSDIESYWKSSELNSIADYNEDGKFDKDTVQSAITDAYSELKILDGYYATETIDLFAKRLTICILLSRMNVNPEAVVLPMNDCLVVREKIDAVMKIIQKNKAEVDNRKVSSGVSVSEGMTDFSDIIVDF